MKFLIIDNYDSFVYNLAQRLGELGINSDVVRNDKITVDEIKKRNYSAIIISPGPGTPEDKKYFGICKTWTDNPNFGGLLRSPRNYRLLWWKSCKCRKR